MTTTATPATAAHRLTMHIRLPGGLGDAGGSA
jgi:hypothetical protein